MNLLTMIIPPCLLLSLPALAGEQTILAFLQQVEAKSKTIQLNESQLAEGLAKADAGLSIFDTNASVGLGVTQSRPTPDGGTGIDRITGIYGTASYSKLWVNGLQTSVNYQLRSNEIDSSLPVPDQSYVPQLSAGVSTNLTKNFLGGNLEFIDKSSAQLKTSLTKKSSLSKKAHYISSLLTLSGILEIEENIKWQKDLCRSVDKQTKKLEQRNKRESLIARTFF